MRQRSLKKDRNDDAQFRHSRERHMGVCVSSEYYQPCPMFFTREGSQLNMIGHYRGDSIFLICNGPSFASLDHSLLQRPGVMTFGINNGPRTFRPNFWTCVDSPERFIKSIWLDPRITKFIPQATMEKRIFDNEKWGMERRLVGECPNVIGYRRNEKFMADRFLFEDTINWGNHKDYGGCRSVMLPAIRISFLLGFRKIYLLGCDLNMREDYAYHFDEQRAKGAVNCNNNTYKRMIEEYFPKLKPEFEAAGLQVFNCNPDSALKVFPHISFEDAIKEATSHLGDVENERTYGMYSKADEKLKWKEEPSEEEKKNLKAIREMEAKRKSGQTAINPDISNAHPPLREIKEFEGQTIVDNPVIHVEGPIFQELNEKQKAENPVVVVDATNPPVDRPIRVGNLTTSTLPPPSTIRVPNDNTLNNG